MFLNYWSFEDIPRIDRDIFRRVYVLSKLYLAYEIAHFNSKPAFQCHSVCRAIARLYTSLKVVDGVYVGITYTMEKGKVTRWKPATYPHSWLMAPRGSIIDAYPVACISSPFLVRTTGELAAFGGGLYVPQPERKKQYESAKVMENTDKLLKILRRINRKSTAKK